MYMRDYPKVRIPFLFKSTIIGLLEDWIFSCTEQGTSTTLSTHLPYEFPLPLGEE